MGHIAFDLAILGLPCPGGEPVQAAVQTVCEKVMYDILVDDESDSKRGDKGTMMPLHAYS